MAYTYKHGDRPLDGVTIQRAVGRGGFGEVYYALSDSGKQIAVKYLRDNPEVELRGIAHVMNLKSPHLITIYDVRNGPENDPFVIMEYIGGPSLRELMDAEPRGVGLQKAAYFMVGIAKGLSYLHERGIVHRDLKPGNIFYDDGYVKIGDYGLSKHMSMSRHSGQTVSVGTVHYMAPEIGSGSYSKAIDIYALGVILYEMITGRLPFTGSSMGEILMRHLNERPDTSGIPEPFATVIARALAKNPHDRYHDVNEMVDAVMSVAEFSQSVSSFDPRALSSIPRHPDATDQRTMTTPPRRPPPLDVRDIGAGLPPIPPIPPIPGARDGEHYPPPPRDPAVRIQVLDSFDPLSIARGTVEWLRSISTNFFRHWPQAVCALIVCAAVGGGLGFLAQPSSGEAAFASGAVLTLMLVGATVSTLFCYGVLLCRIPRQTEVVDRIVYAAGAFVAMLPAIAIAVEELHDFAYPLARLAVPICGVLLLFDWSSRLQDGRKLQLKGHTALGPAVAGLVIAGMVGTGTAWSGAAMCGGFAYAVQLAAAVLPPQRTRTARPIPPDPEFDVPAPHAGGASGFVFAAEVGRGAAAPAGDRTPSPTSVIGVDPPSIGAPAPAIPPAARASRTDGGPIIIDAAQPSFVGRTANAGMAFFGKVLVLLAMTGAVFYHSDVVRFDLDGTTIQYQKGMITTTDGESSQRAARISPAAIVLPMLAGVVFLITSRRNSGGSHVARGVVGCAAAFMAAMLALGPASAGWSELFRSGEFGSGRSAAPFYVSLAMLGVALVLLNWPRRNSARTIVV